MSSTRTPAEVENLKKEAERRVRAGQRRVEAARDLGVPPSTLGMWASAGLWRRKDLAFERDQEHERIKLAKLTEDFARLQEALRRRNERAKGMGRPPLSARPAPTALAGHGERARASIVPDDGAHSAAAGSKIASTIP
jgi:hypothetical protein